MEYKRIKEYLGKRKFVIDSQNSSSVMIEDIEK